MAAVSVPAASSGSTAEREMKVTPYPAWTALRTDSCSPSSSRTSRSRSRVPSGAQLVLDDLADAGALLHHDQALLAKLVQRHGPACEGVAGRACQDHLVVEERLERDGPVAACGADDPELELARSDALDHGLRVGDGQRDPDAGMLALELAEEQRHHDRGRAGRGTDLQLARELALALAGDLVEDLPLQREQPLGAAVEPQPGLGRLDAAAGAVEQLRPEPLLERPHLQRDGRLGDTETLGRLREAAPLDDGAEGGQLACVHKQTL